MTGTDSQGQPEQKRQDAGDVLKRVGAGDVLKWVGAGTASAYALGFIISSVNAAQFAVFPLDFPRPICILSGLWLFVAVGLLALVAAPLLWLCERVKTPEWVRTLGAWVRSRCEKSRAPKWARILWKVSLASVGVVAILWFFSTCLFPLISAQLGGGRPTTCDVLLDTEHLGTAVWDRYGLGMHQGVSAVLLRGVDILYRNSEETVLRLNTRVTLTVPNSSIRAFLLGDAAPGVDPDGEPRIADSIHWSQIGAPTKPGVYTLPNGGKVLVSVRDIEYARQFDSRCRISLQEITTLGQSDKHYRIGTWPDPSEESADDQ